MLEEIPKNNYWKVPDTKKTYDLIINYIWRVFIGLFLYPISSCSILFGKVLKTKKIIVKQLDKTLIDAIRTNENKLAKSLDIRKMKMMTFIELFTSMNMSFKKNHMKKMDNYVALYGFLRSITFISDCATLWITVKYLIPTINISANLNFHLILIWLSCILVTNIFFMAFIKFYRRFTLESFMCLVIDTSFKIVDKAPYHFNYTQPTTLESSIKTV